MASAIMSPLLLTIIIFLNCWSYCLADIHKESLLIQPLSETGKVYAYFEFTTIWENGFGDDRSHGNSHYDLFPMNFGRFLTSNNIQELHFSLTRGRWHDQRWNHLPLRNAGTGAEVWLWFGEEGIPNIESWKVITKQLSGQFCASLNSMDSTITVNPVFSFRPEGVVPGSTGANSSQRVFYASVPHEAVCTENLTPWKKLLPCFGKSGLGTLLTATNVFNSHYFSLGVDVKPICPTESQEGTSSCLQPVIQMTQSISIVFDPPSLFDGKTGWSFFKLFGRQLQSTCPLASSSNIYVDVSRNDSRNPILLSPQPDSVVSGVADRKFAIYDLISWSQKSNGSTNQPFNLANQNNKEFKYWASTTPTRNVPIVVSKSLSGYGVHLGGIISRITNNLNEPMKVAYFDVIPWFLRIYMHSMKITCHEEGKKSDHVLRPQKLSYKPGKDRSSPHHIEIILTLPPKSTTQITLSFERSFLMWTEFLPDANHGVTIPSAIVTAYLPSLAREGRIIPSSTSPIIRFYSEPLLISLPTPDFSMPYNVICLVSTVVSLAFGPLYNLTTNRVQLSPEGEKNGPLSKSPFARLRDWWRKRKENKEKTE